MKSYKNKYGYFDKQGQEFVITRYDTPRPWVNVISNGDFSFIVSQTGGGFSWRGNSNMCRITQWYQDLIRDNWGKYIYLRDNNTGKFWSLGYKPVCVKPKKYEVRQGIGYTIIKNETNGILAELTMFVAKNEPLEIWKVKLTNKSGKKKNLSLFTYFEWCLGNGLETHREFQKTFIWTEYDKNLGAIFGKKKPQLVPKFISSGLNEWPTKAFHSSSIKPSSYEGDKENFIGRYRDLNNPRAVEEGKLRQRTDYGADAVASLKVDVRLNPESDSTVVFTLGSAENEAEAKRLIKKYKSKSQADKALKEIISFWQGYIEAIFVKTPDDAFDIFNNIWLKYQAISGRIWAKAAYYQQSGGIGFRDQLQDSQIFLPIEPQLTKRQILLHARHQFKDGTVYHWWHPLTETGAHTHMSDDLLWLAFVAANYLKETQDYPIFKEKVRYVDDKRPDTLYNHCIKSIEKVLSRFSKRGLPLIGEGDWNDGMSAVGLRWKGESVWLGHFLYGVLNDFVGICGYLKDTKRAKKYAQRAKSLKEAVNKHAWDGKWYFRATRDDGKLIGSRKNEEGKIFLNAHTWPIIHGTAAEERIKIFMPQVRKILYRDYGPLLFYPAYSKPDFNIGYLTRYGAGIRENGGVYSHAGVWAIQAECILGNGDQAFELFSKMCSIKRAEADADLYYSEPYVMPGNVDGPNSANYGRGGWSWYTGAAAWMFRICTEWILGVRPTEKGLLVDPCIPKKWKGFKIRRQFRGVKYEIEVKNPKQVSKGIKEVTVNGKKFQSNILPLYKDKKTCYVKVILG